LTFFAVYWHMVGRYILTEKHRVRYIKSEEEVMELRSYEVKEVKA